MRSWKPPRRSLWSVVGCYILLNIFFLINSYNQLGKIYNQLFTLYRFMGVWMSSRYQKFFQEIKGGRTAILDSGVSTELERQGAPMRGTHWSGRVSICLLYTSPSPRDATLSRMPSSA